MITCSFPPKTFISSRVTLEAFVSTQKHSVTKSMKRTFKSYLSYKKDNNELLLHLLNNLAKEAALYMRNR